MTQYPTDLKYTKDHEWARLESGLARIGITLHAIDQLGDVTLIDLPKVGTKLQAGAHFGDIESVKAVSELFAPISGEVVQVNTALADKPELVNAGPYADGWMLVIKPSNPAELEGLLSAEAYEQLLASLAT